MLVIKISGKARQVFRLIQLLAAQQGDTTLSQIIGKGVRK